MGTDELPKHVLMTSDTLGGVWTYSIELARELTRAGIHVSLATMGNPLRPEQSL
jgi:glycogen synthase